ncbi:integrase core domain-containing protein [Streptomyces sp. NPDC054813]
MAPGRSLPRVSNDNPFSESRFRTTKYASDYPEHFYTLAHAREWMDAFISHHNHEYKHKHSGISLHTPASVHFGTAHEIRDQDAIALADAYRGALAACGSTPRTPHHVHAPHVFGSFSCQLTRTRHSGSISKLSKPVS